MILDDIAEIEARYDELGRMIADPDVIARQQDWQEYVKEHAHLEQIIETYRQCKATEHELEEAREMLGESEDDETRDWLRAEVEELEEQEEQLQLKLRQLLVPKDPRDEKNVIIEIRAGAGGDEAALFAADLYRMYTRYAERQGWEHEVLSTSPTGIGGFKEVAVSIKGKGAFSKLKYESGVHRVQRVPSTESGGRIHTSTATVAVLPEAEEVDINIDQNELEIDTFMSSGPGGQHVNRTESAVRITHVPTGVVVTCQDEKSQHKNKAKAMKVLRARLLAKAEAERDAELAETRREQVGTADRSERIRTYNFRESRVTDHRIGMTMYQLESVLDGKLQEFIDELIAVEETKKLHEAWN
jgi:peptide chain release factor 1